MEKGVPDFSRTAWLAVISESLVKRDLVALCGRLGIEFPGRRLETLPEILLAEPLADIVLEKSGPDRDLVLEKVRSSNHMISERVRGMPLDELEFAAMDPLAWPSSVTPARLQWALASDERAGARKLARDFRFLESQARKQLREAKKAPGIKGAVSDLVQATERLAEVTSEERKRAERDARKIRDLEDQVAGLRKELVERDQRLAARKGDLEAARDESQKARHEAELLRVKLQAQPPGSWEAERRRLEHEVRSLRHELEDARESSRQALEAADRQWEEKLAAERAETEKMRRQAEHAGREAQWLRDKLKSPVTPAAPPRRDPDRVAVLVEVQSLYPLASSRRSRVDYRHVLERAVGGRKLGRALAYVLDVPGTDNAPFKQALHVMGFQVRSKAGRDARSWASGLENDIRDAARTCGTICVATALPDLASVLGSVAAEGVHVTLISFDDPAVAPLRSAAAEFTPIGEDMLRPLPARG